MADFYLLVLDGNIAGISETIANVECAITRPNKINLNKEDEILVYLDNPINKIQMNLKVTENLTDSDTVIKIKKQYETAYGLSFDNIPSDKIKKDITNAKLTNDFLFPISKKDFQEIDLKIKTLINQSVAVPSATRPLITCEDLYKSNRFTNARISEPLNYIFYGAPGTGKSKTCEEMRQSIFTDKECYERVTFYERYSYANFVGSYKPVTKDDGIDYSFVPGPFTRIWLKAITNTDKNYLLIIEEINRAGAASVFGDIFQLLDRDDNGVSEYPITTTEDMKRYLAEEYYNTKQLSKHQLATFNELRIPKNMYIWATMNSMDQGVTALDAAFKRRWNFKYIGINDKETVKAIIQYYIPMPNKTNNKRIFVNWDDLRRKINDKLLNQDSRIPEDKLLGPFFISKSKLNSILPDQINQNLPDDTIINDFIETFKSKVIMYLFDDAAKSDPAAFFNIKTSTNYLILSKIYEEFEKTGVEIFDFKDKIKLYYYDGKGQFQEYKATDN